jgi:hypothetical protein
MNRLFSRLIRCNVAASSAEFAMVAPLMVLMIFGIIDVGRFMWELNQAEKATQLGARFAVVTTPVSNGIVTADYANNALDAGDLIPADRLGALKCTSSGCTCVSTCPEITDMSVNSAAFNAIVARMQVFKPDIAAANVEVTYRGSGFGYAGDAGGTGGGAPPETMEISPLVTVSLTGLTYSPLISLFFADLALPPFSTTLPAEDASGAVSN